jgi:hypothetical protein
LENIEFSSFELVTGDKSYLSASEMSYVVMALLGYNMPPTKSTTIDQKDEDCESLKRLSTLPLTL